MSSNRFAIFVLACSLTGLPAAQAHPGHDHWDQVHELERGIELHKDSEFQGSSSVNLASTAAATSLFVLCLVLGGRSQRMPKFGAAAAGGALITVILFGCRQASDDKSPKERI